MKWFLYIFWLWINWLKKLVSIFIDKVLRGMGWGEINRKFKKFKIKEIKLKIDNK